MLAHLINIHYCYDFLLNQIPVGLLIYTHIPTALIALLFGGYLVWKNRSLPSLTLFMVCIGFAVWCLFDISTWFSFLGSGMTMFTWSSLDLVGLVFFFYSYYFLYTFTTKRDLPLWQKISGIVLLLPTAIWTFFGYNLTGFDANSCEAVENPSFTSYFFYIAAIFLVAAIVLTIFRARKANDLQERKQTILACSGIVIFLLFFYTANLAVSLLAESNLGTYAYNFEIYGLFGMPILLIYLGRLILKYRAFNLKLFTAQALVVGLIVLVGSQFAFLNSLATILLNAGTLLLVLIFGIFLIRSVRKEIEQKEHLAVLTKQLEESNEKLKSLDKLKTEFLSLASHQLRSPLTAIKGYASMMDEGSLGKLNAEQDTAAKRIYASAQGLVNLVEDLLNVSKIEQGGMKYEMMPVDLAKVANDLAGEMKIPAENKGLELRVAIPPNDQFTMTADPTKIKQVFLNLVDNSIKYTATGFVEIGLSRGKNNAILFTVKDSGVGVTSDTKEKLFQKFSRGGEGSKMNTGGSGLGLYLAQEIVKAHKGDIQVDSEGLGKGTTFTVTFPAA